MENVSTDIFEDEEVFRTRESLILICYITINLLCSRNIVNFLSILSSEMGRSSYFQFLEIFFTGNVHRRKISLLLLICA